MFTLPLRLSPSRVWNEPANTCFTFSVSTVYIVHKQRLDIEQGKNLHTRAKTVVISFKAAVQARVFYWPVPTSGCSPDAADDGGVGGCRNMPS